MRRYTTAMAVAGAVIAAAAGVALAAAPAPNHKFSGSGRSYMVKNGRWAVNGSAHFHFRTSGKRLQTNGTFVYIENFSGTYINCRGKKLILTATNVPVSVKTGKFNFRSPRTYNGARIRLWGSFGGSGDFAKVNYLANFSSSNTNPKTIHSGCASWVRGTATTH